MKEFKRGGYFTWLYATMEHVHTCILIPRYDQRAGTDTFDPAARPVGFTIIN